MTLASVMLWAAQAPATQTLYNNNCVACHSQVTNTCDGCHAHGVHSSSAKNDINISGTTDKTSYAPGSPVKVTVNGGYRSGWVRVVLFDQNLKELARSSCPGGLGGCTTSAFPITLTAPAPMTAGTYVWAVAWYGNDYEVIGASFGSGTSSTLKVGFFTADVNNSNHGYQTVALPAFSVSAASAPAIALNPTSLDFQTVTVGSSKTLSTQVQNTGTAPLNVTGVSSCPGTPGSVTWAPTGPFTVAAGGNASLSVTFAPTAAGALPAGACLAITSNDPAKPTVNLGVSGTATNTAAPAIALNPTSLNFQTVTVGSSKMLSTQVQNAGTAPLNVTGVSSCPGTPGSVTWAPTGSFTVAPGGNASLSVTFAPTAAGALPAGACLAIANNDPAKPTVNLGVSGTAASAVGPAITLEPASLDFQTVVIATPRKLTTRVHNTGDAALDLTSIALCRGTPTMLSWTPAVPVSVAPGASLTLSVLYTPAAAGALPAGSCLAIASNDPANATVELSVSGSGSSGFTFEPPPIGCSTGGSMGSFLGLLALLLLIARRKPCRAVGRITVAPANRAWNLACERPSGNRSDESW